ncbi:MAG: LamG domain-containing protein, partial [Chitinispirillaceae bacterium]|nr:LamG domain-containing protein [Chitinispirillaceae bacterium]
SEVGVMVFVDRVSSTLQPLSLDNESNYTMIQSAIDGAGCTGRTIGGGGGGLAKTTAVKETNCGLALQQALVEADRNFDAMSAEMKEGRHIILLTDGAWDDKETLSPQTLYEAYGTSFPDRTLPTVHGIFLSDSATHVAHGYPPEGCAENDIVDMSYLEYAAVATGGIFEPGSHPETVVEEFTQLLNQIINMIPQTLSQMSVTNTTNGAIRGNTTIQTIESTNEKQAHYQTTIDNLPLEFGLNTLIVRRVVQKPGTQATDTITSTVNVYRTQEWTSTIIQSEYEEFCVLDSTDITIAVTPVISPVNTPFTVNSTIQMKEKLILDTIQVRAFTQFPDDDPQTVALFHLDQNLDNAAGGGGKGTESSPVDYSTADSLFGKSVMKQGSFQTSIGDIAGDFALEAWINPSSAGGQTDIFSTGGLTLGIGADRFLYLTLGGAQTIKSRIAVDANVWSHIAVSRASGVVRIYINAVDVSDPVEFAGALQGALMIACPTGGLLDEVRIGSASRMRADSIFPRLDIPSLQSPTWIINGQSITQPVALLSPDMWNNGNIQFQISSSIPGQLVVNFQHLGSVESRWSKNGNSVYAVGELRPTVVITVTPDTALVNNPFDVQATIILKPWMTLDTIQVRVFTQFPDADPSTVDVFHLEDNVTSAGGTEGAAGSSLEFSETDVLFGTSVMSGGSFSTGIGNIAGDFALEAWIKPSDAGGETEIFSGSGFTFGIDADRLLYFTADGTELVKAVVPVDATTWSHVAVSRAGGNLMIFVNGINVSKAVPFAGSLIGTMTVSCPEGGLLDEVRISTAGRQRPDPNGFRLDIPSLQNPVWIVGGTTVTQPFLAVSPGMWTDGTIHFQFASPIQGKLIVNFQHKGKIETQWTKNSNAVFAAGDLQGPFITKAIFVNGLMGEIYDTLFVEFSEPVKCDSLKKNPLPIASFQVYGPDDATGAYVLKPNVFEGAFYADGDACPSTYITKATIVTLASVDAIVPKKDSIMLVGSAVDTAENYPDTTRKRLVEWGPGRGIVIMPYQNDAVAPMTLPEGIRRRTGVQQREGKAIIIQTRGPLVPVIIEGQISYGRTVIFDAVANVVAVNLPILPFPNNNRMYYVIWDGTNRQRRRVASGAYLLRASVQYENEDPNLQPPPLMAKFSIKWSSGY